MSLGSTLKYFIKIVSVTMNVFCQRSGNIKSLYYNAHILCNRVSSVDCTFKYVDISESSSSYESSLFDIVCNLKT